VLAENGPRDLAHVDISARIQRDPVRGDELTRRLAREEGLLTGQSSGAILLGVFELLKEVREGVIVAIFPDGGDKYLTTNLWA